MAKKKLEGGLSKKELKKLRENLFGPAPTKKTRPKIKVIDPYSQGYVKASIPVYRGVESRCCSVYNTLENITAQEEKLSAKRITFDIGYEPFSGSRVWDLDWSLKGAKPNLVLAHLRKQKILYNVEMIRDI